MAIIPKVILMGLEIAIPMLTIMVMSILMLLIRHNTRYSTTTATTMGDSYQGLTKTQVTRLSHRSIPK
jgi:hypothetical protein